MLYFNVMKSRESRGFSLTEVLLVMALMGMLLALGISNMGYSQKKAASKALAQVLTEELKTARQHAMAAGVPVGIGFPTEEGTRSHCQSVYILEGEVNPKVTRVVNFATEFDATDIFVGQWSLATGALRDPTAVNTTVQPAVAGGFDASTWGAPFPDDHLLVFTPAGTVVTNGLVNFDGEFHLVVAQGVQYGGDPAELSKAGSPQTITITPEGAVSKKSALIAGTGQAVDARIQSSLAHAEPPALAAATNDKPVFIEINRYPRGHGSYRPPGVDVMVDKDGYATLEVFADDSNGDELYCRWETDSGFLSKEGWVRMEWDRANNRWVSVWNWRPDPDVDTVATLTCTVKDGKDEVADTIAACVKKAQKTDYGKIVFSANLDGDNEIYIMNGDGSGLTQLTFNDYPDYYPDLSEDGSLVTWVSYNGNTAGGTQLAVMKSDGSDTVFISPGWSFDFGEFEHPQFSPDGTKIAFLIDEPGDHHHVFVTSMESIHDPNGLENFTDELSQLAEAQHPAWSPDGDRVYLAYNETTQDQPESIGWLSYPPDGNWSPHSVATASAGEELFAPSISKNGDVIYKADTPTDSDYIMKTGIDGGTPVPVYTGKVNRPTWSPDGEKILFGLNSKLHTVDSVGNDLKTVTLFGVNDASWSE